MAYLLFQSEKILVFATENTQNTKIGAGTQVWIMDATMHPLESRKTGNDAKLQCQGCKLSSNNGCYVAPMPLLGIWRSYIEGRAKFIQPGSSEWSKLFVNQFVRLGAYGNPSMIPLPLLKRIIKDCRAHTGYFHDWHLMEPQKAKEYGKYFMASCDLNNYKQAQALGLRTYTISDKEVPGSVECYNKTKGITCLECKTCEGTLGGTKNVYINSHGYQINKARQATQLAT